MICPNCKTEIKNPTAIAGGKKSRRTLTTEQAKKMVEIRESKRKLNGYLDPKEIKL